MTLSAITMSVLDYALALPILVGHLALCIGAANRIRATGLSDRAARLSTAAVYAMLILVPAGLAACYAVFPGSRDVLSPTALSTGPALAYLVPCWVIALAAAAVWIMRRTALRGASPIVTRRTERVSLVDEIGRRPIHGWTAAVLARVPGNEIFDLHVCEKIATVPRLAPALDGLTIAQLSDLHFAGQLEKPFFEHVVRHVNDLEADIVAVTGDLVDHARFIRWIPDTLGRLTGRHGVYFVLGNHDRKVPDVAALRRALTEAGLVDLGGRCVRLLVGGRAVILAGNELPWFAPAPEIERVKTAGPGDPPLRILLTHTPDQIQWARAHDFDLLLAGHTHGGQIRLPLVGAVVCPSRFGVKYARGGFYEEPTLMHVNCGVSGKTPIRINCPPEVTKLVLRSPRHA